MSFNQFSDLNLNFYSIFSTNWFFKDNFYIFLNKINFFLNYQFFYSIIYSWLNNWYLAFIFRDIFFLDLTNNVIWDSFIDNIVAKTSIEYLKYFKYYTAQLMLFQSIAYFGDDLSSVKIEITKVNLEYITIFSNAIYALHRWLFLLSLFFFVFFLTKFGIKVKNLVKTNVYTLKFKFIQESIENSWGSFDDMQYIFFFLLKVFLTLFLGLFMVSCSYISTVNWTILSIVFFSKIILTMPTNVIWTTGLFFGTFLRGASSTNNSFIEALFDLLAVFIVFTRFVVQNIRLVLIFVAYFELYEFFFNVVEINTIIDSFSNNIIDNLNFLDILTSYENLIFLFIIIMKLIFTYLYSFLHFIVIFYMQISVFVVLSVWLYFFLYDLRIKNKKLNFFKNLK